MHANRYYEHFSELIYEQIGVQIKKLILSGDLKQGDALPSMRQLAKDLRVSIITTKRAYEELEKTVLFIQLSEGGPL